jgi:hypothetical protein
MSDPSEIITRLESEYASSLVTITLDFLLQKPINSVLPASFVANQFSLILQTAIEGGETERWITEQVQNLREQVPPGTPKDYFPSSVQAPLRHLLLQEMELEQRLLRRLMEHQAVEDLFRDILTEVLNGFTDSLKNMTSNVTTSSSSNLSKGFGRLRAFGDKALKETSLGGFAQMLEAQAQRKTSEYIDKSIFKVLDLTAQRLAASENSAKQGEYRVHVLEVLLSTENNTLLQQIDVVETDIIVSTISETIRALLLQENFQQNLQSAIEKALQEFGDKSMHDLMEEAGLRHDWRTETEDVLNNIVQEFIQENSFSTWLKELLG